MTRSICMKFLEIIFSDMNFEIMYRIFVSNGWIQTLFLWILKSSNFGISTISSDSQSKMSQESKKIRSRDRRIFEKNPYYEIKTLTHNNVNTVSDRSN